MWTLLNRNEAPNEGEVGGDQPNEVEQDDQGEDDGQVDDQDESRDSEPDIFRNSPPHQPDPWVIHYHSLATLISLTPTWFCLHIRPSD